MRKGGFCCCNNYFALFLYILSTTEMIFGKIKYLPSRVGDARVGPSRVGDARVGLEACSVGKGGGMAGLCPVHAMQE